MGRWKRESTLEEDLMWIEGLRRSALDVEGWKARLNMERCLLASSMCKSETHRINQG